MTCKEFRKYLYAFADGELATKENLEALEHLNMCPGCSRKVAVQQAMRKAVAERYRDESAPQGLRARVRTGLQQEPDRSPWRPVLRVFVPLAAAAVVALLALPRDLGVGDAATGDARIAQLISERHIKCCGHRDGHHDSDLPMEASALQTALTDRNGFPVIAPKLAGYALQSANHCGIDNDYPGSHLLYKATDGTRLVSVFSVRPALTLAGRKRVQGGGTYHLLQSDAHGIVAWNDKSVSHVLCSKCAPEALLELVAPAVAEGHDGIDRVAFAADNPIRPDWP